MTIDKTIVRATMKEPENYSFDYLRNFMDVYGIEEMIRTLDSQKVPGRLRKLFEQGKVIMDEIEGVLYNGG